MVLTTIGNLLNQEKMAKYIKWAGGPSYVAGTLKLSRTTVWKWTKVGFPDTDFSGKTAYASKLAKLCVLNGHNVLAKTVLLSGRP